MEQVKAIRLTSANSHQALTIEVNQIKAVEGVEGKGSKIYTENKGNFYVKENEASISNTVFGEVNIEDLQARK